jgi:hypothetical protein
VANKYSEVPRSLLFVVYFLGFRVRHSESRFFSCLQLGPNVGNVPFWIAYLLGLKNVTVQISYIFFFTKKKAFLLDQEKECLLLQCDNFP